jgi:hypothetical protein
MWAMYLCIKKLPKVSNRPKRESTPNLVTLGSMLWSQIYAICANFRQKIGVFLKTNFIFTFLHNLAAFWVKNAYFFAIFLGENILKIITSVPGFIAPETRLIYPSSADLEPPCESHVKSYVTWHIENDIFTPFCFFLTN